MASSTIQGLIAEAATPAQKAAIAVAGIEALSDLGDRLELDTSADSAALSSTFQSLPDSSMKSGLAQSPALTPFREARQSLTESVEAAGQSRQMPARTESAADALRGLREAVAPPRREWLRLSRGQFKRTESFGTSTSPTEPRRKPAGRVRSRAGTAWPVARKPGGAGGAIPLLARGC